MSYQLFYAAGVASVPQTPVEDYLPESWRQMAYNLLSLEEGWDAMGDGERIMRATVHGAISAMFALREHVYEDFRLQPGSAGEVLIICDKATTSIEVVVTPEEQYELYLENEGDEVYENSDLSFSQLLREIALKCNTLESSAPSISITKRVDSPEWRSGLHLMEAFRSSMPNAQYQAAGQFASTFKPTIAA